MSQATVQVLEPDVVPESRESPKVATRGARGRLAPAIWVLPAVLLIAVWIYGPLVFNAVLSFMDWQLNNPGEFIGLENYQNLLADPVFWRASGQTILYAVLLLPFATLVPLLLAVMLWQRLSRLTHFYRALIFMPMLVAPVALAASWQFILTPLNGLANEILGFFGHPGYNWLGDPQTALLVIAVVTAGKVVAMNFLLYSASLSAVPRNLIDAAALDGANSFDITFRVVLPQLKMTVLMLAALSTITAGQWAFNNIAILTGGGPEYSTDNIYHTIYRLGFTFFETGEAAAAAVVLLLATLLIIGVVRLVQRNLSRRRAKQ